MENSNIKNPYRNGDLSILSVHFLCISSVTIINITKTCLFKYIKKFHLLKTENFQTKNFDIFHISAQNIDCGYLLEYIENFISKTINFQITKTLMFFIFLLKT